jgi:hypothetical protein
MWTQAIHSDVRTIRRISSHYISFYSFEIEILMEMPKKSSLFQQY